MQVVTGLVMVEQNSDDFDNFDLVVPLVLIQESIANCCNVLYHDMSQDASEVLDQRIFDRNVVVDNYLVLFLEIVDDYDEARNSVDLVGIEEDNYSVDKEERSCLSDYKSQHTEFIDMINLPMMSLIATPTTSIMVC